MVYNTLWLFWTKQKLQIIIAQDMVKAFELSENAGYTVVQHIYHR